MNLEAPRVGSDWSPLPLVMSLARWPRARSADLQSAVSQVFNLPHAACDQRSADYKSAIRQIKNLRYGKQIPGGTTALPF